LISPACLYWTTGTNSPLSGRIRRRSQSPEHSGAWPQGRSHEGSRSPKLRESGP